MATHSATCLSISDRNDIYILCEPVRAGWLELATYLKVDVATIDAIKVLTEDPGRKLSDVLSAWLKRTSPTQPRPTWSVLCEALSHLDRNLSERIASDHPNCQCTKCTPPQRTSPGNDRSTPVAQAVRHGDAKAAATELRNDFKDLFKFLVKEIDQVEACDVRIELIDHFKYEDGGISKKVNKHLEKIENYEKSSRILTHFFRHNFIGYINYSLIKVFQQTVKSPLLAKRIEEYEKDYKIFLELSLMDVHKVFQKCSHLRPEYPVGIPKFKIYLKSEWDGKSMLELREFLELLCRLNPDDIDQLMIAKIEHNCIIITFAVLPHIAQRVVECLTAKDVVIILESNGVSVDISTELLQYQTQLSDHDVTLSDDSLEPVVLGANQLSGDIKLDCDKDTGFSDITTEGAARIVKLKDDVSLPEAVNTNQAVLTIKMQRITDLDTAEKIALLEKTKKSEMTAKEAESGSQQAMTEALTTNLQHLSINTKSLVKNKQSEGLLTAAESGDTDTVKRLIALGADVEFCNEYHQTPLHYASKHGHSEVVQVLLSHGATVDTKNRNRQTPLHYASEHGHNKVVQVLLSHGATVDMKNKNSQTALHYASEHGHNEVVKVLISHKATVDMKNRYNLTPLHYASKHGHSEVVQVLLSHGATVDMNSLSGQTPLLLARLKGHNETADLLVSHGTTVDRNNQTPSLHDASERGHSEVVQVLLSHGATVDMKNGYGQTPLLLALLKGHNKTADLLVSRGADLYQEDEYDQSPVLVATVLNNEEFLMSHGVSEDIVKKYRLPTGWKAVSNHSIQYINTVTGKKLTTHPTLH